MVPSLILLLVRRAGLTRRCLQQPAVRDCVVRTERRTCAHGVARARNGSAEYTREAPALLLCGAREQAHTLLRMVARSVRMRRYVRDSKGRLVC